MALFVCARVHETVSFVEHEGLGLVLRCGGRTGTCLVQLAWPAAIRTRERGNTCERLAVVVGLYSKARVNTVL